MCNISQTFAEYRDGRLAARLIPKSENGEKVV